MIQPTVLAAIGANGTFRGRGLLARFLYAVPPSKVGHRLAGAPPVPEDVAAAYAALVERLVLDLADRQGDDGGPAEGPALLTLTPEAAALVVDLERTVEPRLAEGAPLGHLADWGAKLVGATLRLAGLLHLATYPRGWGARPVDVDILTAAAALADYYAAHAARAWGAMATDPATEAAEHLLRVLAKIGAPTVTVREMFRAARGAKVKTVSDLEGPVARLVEHGWIVPAEPDEDREHRPGRKPSPTFHVHPRALDH